MRTIFDACQPRPDVLAGELRDDMFAARLEDVVRGTADPVYQDPQVFLDNTYPSAGLKNLIGEVLGRATGKKPTANPTIRLETSFGGGKTHSLIALYHLARGVRPTGLDRLELDVLPDAPIRVAAVVGTALDPAAGVRHADCTTRTIWGEIAHQLGAYEVIRSNDEERLAPSTQTLDRVFGDEPTIVLIDELARYLTVAAGQSVGQRTLADQTTAFLAALLELAASRERLVVVYTLASSSDAFADDTAAVRAVTESRRVSARTEHVISPTGEDEIAQILGRRLFQSVDRQATEEIAAAYHDLYATYLERGADLPANAATAGYAADIRRTYPFHPELLRTLNEKVATIPNFQRTRGALRLLAQVVRRLWRRRPADTYLIHPHHVDLSDEGILNDLTSRLDRPTYRQVVEADIANPMAGARAHAAIADTDILEAGRPPYGTRLATTVFLHSLVSGVAAGITPAEAKLAVLVPGDDLDLVERQLERLLQTCWYLDLSGFRLRFSTEPSVAKVVADETGLVARTAAKQELDRRVRLIWPRGVFEPEYFPAEPSDVEDAFDRPRLAIIHYDAAGATATDEAPPELVVRIAGRAGAGQTFRRYRNNVLFLVADVSAVEHAVEQARRYLALQRLTTDPDRLNDFPAEQRDRLKRLANEAELELRVAVTRMYRHLYYPDLSAPEKHGRLAHSLLPAQDRGDVERDQSQVILRVLRDLGKVLTADDPAIAPQFVREKAWPGGERATTLQLRQEFAARIGLRMLLDIDKLKTAIKDGIRQGLWLYYDPRAGCAYSKESATTPFVEVSSDVELILPERAAGVPICGVPTTSAPAQECPVCHRPIDQCVCAPVAPGDALLRADGSSGEAFSRLVDGARDRGIEKVRTIELVAGGSKAGALRDLRATALAVPQLGKARVAVDARLVLRLQDGTDVRLEVRGPWERYRTFHDVIAKLKDEDVTDAEGSLRLTLTFDGGLAVDGPGLSMIRDVFVQLDPGRISLTAVPFEVGEVPA